jgi:hypothetical protein
VYLALAATATASATAATATIASTLTTAVTTASSESAAAARCACISHVVCWFVGGLLFARLEAVDVKAREGDVQLSVPRVSSCRDRRAGNLA